MKRRRISKYGLYDSILRAFPEKLRGAIDYHIGHHSLFYPWGGPMNGQTARLEAVRALVFEVQPKLIVETGTFRGTTTQWLAQLGFPVISVEVNRRYHEFSRRRLEHMRNVSVRLGNSVDFLKEMIVDTGAVPATTVFYIDSHWGKHLPLRSEMETIFRRFTEFVVIIDDFKVENDDGYAYDDYGPGQQLTIELLLSYDLPGMSVFFPSVAGKRETGARRGAVFVTASPTITNKLCRQPLLTRWLPPEPSAPRHGQPHENG